MIILLRTCFYAVIKEWLMKYKDVLLSFEIQRIKNGFLLVVVDKSEEKVSDRKLEYVYAEKEDDILETIKEYLSE